MPIYEYRCHGCRRRVSVFFRSFSSTADPICPQCGSRELTKLVSRVAVMKSEESRLEDLADPSSLGDLDENDPKSIARWARKMGEQMGEDLGPEYEEMVDRLEAGEMPDDDGMPGMGNGGDFGGPLPDDL
jgi:putative FmdB family regulatory protein